MEGNRELSTPSLPPSPPSLSQTRVPILLLPETQPVTATVVRYIKKELDRRQQKTVHPIRTPHSQQVSDKRGTHLVVARTPSQRQPPWSDTLHGPWSDTLHGEGTGHKMAVNYSPHPYPPRHPPTPAPSRTKSLTNNKSLTNMGTHLVVARNPASNSHHGQIHGERIRWKATENCPRHPYPTTTTNKSLTAVGTHLVVAGNPASNSHHGQIHGERIRWKATENCPRHPYPTTTTNKSLTAVGTHLVVAGNPASNSQHGQIHGERIRWKATENCPLHPYPTTTTTTIKSLTAVGTHLVVAGNPASDSHNGQIHEKKLGKRQQRTAHPIATPYRQQVFDSRGYPPCNRKPSQGQPPWSDTRRKN